MSGQLPVSGWEISDMSRRLLFRRLGVVAAAGAGLALASSVPGGTASTASAAVSGTAPLSLLDLIVGFGSLNVVAGYEGYMASDGDVVTLSTSHAIAMPTNIAVGDTFAVWVQGWGIDVSLFALNGTDTVGGQAANPYTVVGVARDTLLWFVADSTSNWALYIQHPQVGVVRSVVAGPGIAVDSSNPAAPVVSAASGAAPLFNIATYGAVGDGQTDDTAAVQAAVNAAAATGGGTIFWPPGCLTKLQRCITLPSYGSYRFTGAGAASNFYSVNDGYAPGQRATGIVVDGNIAGCPVPVTSLGPNVRCIFDATGATPASTLNVEIDNLLLDNRLGAGCVFAYAGGGNTYVLNIHDVVSTGVALAATLTGVGNGQTYLVSIRSCLGSGLMLLSQNNPFLGEIAGCTWYSLGDGLSNPAPIGEVIDISVFNTWFIHHNVLQAEAPGRSMLNPRAMIAIHSISQTELGSVDHNAIYGAFGGCIYYRDDNPAGPNNPTGGLTIDANEFCNWNQAAKTGVNASTAAVLIDHSTAPAPQQMVTIGKNNWNGQSYDGAQHALYGLVIADNPDTAAVVFDHDQNMRNIVTAPYRINGVNYVTAGTSHRFQANLSAPPIPQSNNPLKNPFGFDTTVYVAHGTVTAVSINGTSTGLTNGMFRVPRDATITVTYKAPPTWTWFAD
jgi:hypothetical protein